MCTQTHFLPYLYPKHIHTYTHIHTPLSLFTVLLIKLNGRSNTTGMSFPDVIGKVILEKLEDSLGSAAQDVVLPAQR